MPKGQMQCPICKGTGIRTEDSKEYEFVTRDPETSTCLICAGRGWLATKSKLPDGRLAREIKAENERAEQENLKKPVTDLVDFSAHDGKLPKWPAENEPVLVVREYESYFIEVYRLIRSEKKKQGRWMETEETAYVEALERAVTRLRSAEVSRAN